MPSDGKSVYSFSGGTNVQRWGAIAAAIESWAVDFPRQAQKCGVPQKTARATA